MEGKEREIGTSKFETRFKDEDSVKDFVRYATKKGYDVDLTDGRYTVDGKSIMGIYSIELNKKLVVTLHTEDENELREFKEKFGEK